VKAEDLMAPPSPITSLSVPQYPTYKSIEIFIEKTSYVYISIFTIIYNEIKCFLDPFGVSSILLREK
jgi:hypothetical protein